MTHASDTWRGVARAWLGGTLLAAAVWAHAAEPEARVVTFSPQGAVPAAQQVRATFSEPMLPLGQVTAPSPFDADCALQGNAHWVDDRTWVMDLKDQALDGQACEFRVKPSLKSLAGHAVREPRTFRFQLPVLTEDMRRKVVDVLPRAGADWVAEDQAFLLTYSLAMGSTPPDVRCEAPGHAEAPVVRLPAETREMLSKQVSWRSFTADTSEAVRCPFPLAPGRSVTLKLMRGALKPDVLQFHVRTLPGVEVDCTRLTPGGDCAPSFPMALRFNAAMPESALRAVRLVDAQASRLGQIEVRLASAWAGASSVVTFSPEALKPQSRYRLQWPEQDLVDVDGRPLPHALLPGGIQTLPALGVAYFSVPALAVSPLRADSAVPVLIQGAHTQVTVREKHLNVATASDAELLRWLGVPPRVDGLGHYFWVTGLWQQNWLAKPETSRLPADGTGVPLVMLPAGASADVRQGQVALRGAGLHLLELQASPDQPDLGPLHDSAAVLLTRMAVHLKVARQNSAVWVTRMDGGAPVGGVALKAYDCRGAVAWQGRSNDDGLAIIDKPLPNCEGHVSANWGVTLVARHTWPDGERDVSVANSKWPTLFEPGSYGVESAFGRSAIQAHTVLDRSLFKPGETVSMRHVVRLEDNTGLQRIDPLALPAMAKVMHAPSDKEWTVPVIWNAAGEGQSSFELPADAPLGGYFVELQIKDAASPERPEEFGTAEFAVEAFRLPAMTGAIQAAQPRWLFGATPALGLQLHYADGGAAQHWPVTLNAYAVARGRQAPAALAAYDSHFGSFDTRRGAATEAVPQQVLLHTQALALDARGQAQVNLPALPTRREPYTLHVELSYQDPNGETQTVSQDFGVQPSLLQVGVRTVGTAAVGRRMKVQSLVVDEAGARKPAQEVSVHARRKAHYGAEAVDNLGEICRGVTDTNGELRCDFVPPQPGMYQFDATLSDANGHAGAGYSRPYSVGETQLSTQPLFVHADRVLYRAGDTADLAIAGPFAKSRVWLTLERQGILESRVVMLDAAQSHIRLPIRREWAGNVVVSLLALDADATGRIPGAAAGVTQLVVSTDTHALRVNVAPNRVRYQPRDQATVRVRVAMPDGRALPAARRLSIAVVDEALLSLKDNPSWDLLAHMLPPRSHAVLTTGTLAMSPVVNDEQMLHSAERALVEMIQDAWRRRNAVSVNGNAAPLPAPLMEAAPMAAGSLRRGTTLESVVVSGTRGEPKDVASPPTRTLLDSLLYWQADVPVDDKGQAVVRFPIKDALSRFRVVAVASAGTEDFGTGTAPLDVMQDLQLTAGLPPQVRDGDRFAALVTVRNTSAGAISLNAGAQLTGQAALPVKALQLAAGESRQLSWDVSVPTGAQALGWTFTAKEQGRAGRQDVLQVTQQVEPTLPVTVQAATLAQVNGRFDVPAFGVDSAEATGARVAVQLLPSLAGHLGGVQAWLGAYPYRCLEQTASRAIGMHDRAAWDAAMVELPRYLDDDGLANYFPHSPSLPALGSDTLTGYLLDVADTSGWPIPDGERKRMLDGLARFAAGDLKRAFWSPRDDHLARQVAAMATLSRYGRLSAAQVATVRIDADEWTTALLTDWLTLLKKSQLQPGAQATQAMAESALRARLSYQGRRITFSTERHDYWWWLMSHGDVDAARLLLAVADLPDWQADLPRLLTGLLSRQRKDGAWATTNANAWGTLAVDAFAKQLEAVPVAGATHITLGQRQQTVDWSAAGTRPLDAALDPATDALHIQHDGPGAPWASIEVRAAVPLKSPRFAGYSVARSITPVQQKTPGQWHVGDIARIRLNIDAQADMSWVVVNDPVPAGASILGTGLGRDSAAAQAGEQRDTHAWPLYQARDYTAFKSFYRYVPRGEFSVEYTIRLNNPGQFALTPSRVEAMYAPEVFGETPNAVFVIEP